MTENLIGLRDNFEKNQEDINGKGNDCLAGWEGAAPLHFSLAIEGTYREYRDMMLKISAVTETVKTTIENREATDLQSKKNAGKNTYGGHVR